MSNNAPEIRFKGFTDAWVQRKLGEVSDFSKGNGYSKNDLIKSGIPIILYGRLYTKYETIISQVDTFVNEKSASVYSCGGEVIVPASGETAEDISRASVVENSGILLGGDLNIIAPYKGLEPTFLALNITNGRPHKEMSKLAQGKSVVHLHNSDLEKIDLLYPSYMEQAVISTFFKSLDETITLHKRKLDGLKKLKAGYLQQMFPQAGECVLRVRFAGFTEPWEVRKLGEVADIVGGGTPSTSNDDYWGGDIDWYAPAEIGEQIHVFDSQKKITEIGLQKSSAKILPIGTVLFTSRAGIGNTAILLKAGATNQGFQSIVPHKDGLDSYFIFSRTYELKRYAETVGAGSTFVEVSGKQMAEMPIFVPTMNEQTAIGNLFRSLDEQILAQQQKLDKLKQLKAAYLQKMFI